MTGTSVIASLNQYVPFVEAPFDVGPDTVDYVSGSIGVAHGHIPALPLTSPRSEGSCPEIQRCTGVVATLPIGCVTSWTDQRGRQFSHHAQANSWARSRGPAGATLHAPPLSAGRCPHRRQRPRIAMEFSIAVKHWLAASFHIYWRAAGAHRAIYEVTERFTNSRPAPREVAASPGPFQGRERHPSTPCRFDPPRLNRSIFGPIA